MSTAISCKEMINSYYAVDQIGHPNRQQTISQVKQELANDGCAVIRNFFSEKGLSTLLSEAGERSEQTYYSPKKQCNVYLGDGNPELPEDHPQNIFLERTNGFITADLFGKESVSYQLYYWEPLKLFLADCLKKKNSLFMRILFQI